MSLDELHVIVISSVRPEATSAGQVVLQRHLVDRPGITLEVYGAEPKRPTISRLIRRLVGRLSKDRANRFVEDFWVMWDGRWIDSELPRSVQNPRRTIVLTVAHGDGFFAAMRFAQRHGLPLVSVFHDWWPDMVNAHAPMKRKLEYRFVELAQRSTLAFCVSEGMREALGAPRNAVVLPPISAATLETKMLAKDCESPFRVLYSGNLAEYGAMLGNALEESLKQPEILLQVRGSNPEWSEVRKTKMRAEGRWLDFAPRSELEGWLSTADAFLIPQVFDHSHSRRMSTNFPSKLCEFAQFGKPLVVWAPPDASAARWARDGDWALCVTESDPNALLKGLEKLAQSLALKSYYAAKANEAAENCFNPKLIQKQFEYEIREAMKKHAFK